MQTGIGVIVEVDQILWIQESSQYPAEERYIGELETVAGETLGFAADVSVPIDQGRWKAIGRIDWNQNVLKIANHSKRINDRN
jgi:hypothetical protein